MLGRVGSGLFKSVYFNKCYAIEVITNMNSLFVRKDFFDTHNK